jgi:hypothetical protein
MDFTKKYLKYESKLLGGANNNGNIPAPIDNNNPNTIFQELMARPDFHGNIADFPTPYHAAVEITRLDNVAHLAAYPPFIASGQNIANFQSTRGAQREYARLFNIEIISRDPDFIASGRNVSEFTTLQSTLQDVNRILARNLMRGPQPNNQNLNQPAT